MNEENERHSLELTSKAEQAIIRTESEDFSSFLKIPIAFSGSVRFKHKRHNSSRSTVVPASAVLVEAGLAFVMAFKITIK